MNAAAQLFGIDCILMTKLNPSFFTTTFGKNDIKALNKLGIVVNIKFIKLYDAILSQTVFTYLNHESAIIIIC